MAFSVYLPSSPQHRDVCGVLVDPPCVHASCCGSVFIFWIQYGDRHRFALMGIGRHRAAVIFFGVDPFYPVRQLANSSSNMVTLYGSCNLGILALDPSTSGYLRGAVVDPRCVHVSCCGSIFTLDTRSRRSTPFCMMGMGGHRSHKLFFFFKWIRYSILSSIIVVLI